MRLIDADEFRKRIDHYPPNIRDIAKKELRYVKTIEAEPVSHGKWLFNGYQAKCSVCEDIIELEDGQRWDSPYCPSCGSKMDETI